MDDASSKVCCLPRVTLASATRRYGLTARALRFYEELGLIEARRDHLNSRFYEPDALRRLDWIALLRRAGVPLGDIRTVLDAEGDDARRRDLALIAVDRRQAELVAQFAELRAAREVLLGQHSAGRRAIAAPT